MKHKPVILIVDDNEGDLFLLGEHIAEWGYLALTAKSGKEALHKLAGQAVDLVISDQLMDEMDGIDLLKHIKQTYSTTPFIMLTAYGEIPKAVEAMRQGADDYLVKPYDPGEFRIRIERLLAHSRATQEYHNLQEYLNRQYGVEDFITVSPQMRVILEKVATAAQSPSEPTVLICGESGVGKELIAKAVHRLSSRRNKPMITVNCGALETTVITSELFGHERGAFTGTVARKIGYFELADHGTIFLDEIGELSPDVQVKFLRVLQEGEFQRLGGTTTLHTDVRVIAATNRNLEHAMKHGQFREDLFYRLNVISLHIPPLRERKEDIPALVNHFVARFGKKEGKHLTGVSAEAMQMLTDYQWPGNIRELENCLQNAIISTKDNQIKPVDLNINSARFPNLPEKIECGLWFDDQTVRLVFESKSDTFSLEKLTEYTLREALRKCDNMLDATKLLKVARNRFFRRGIKSGKPKRRSQ